MLKNKLNILTWFAIISIAVPFIAILYYLMNIIPWFGVTFFSVLIILAIANVLGKRFPIFDEGNVDDE